MTKKKELNIEDKKVWDEYIKNPSDIHDKERHSSDKIKQKERYKFDLHGYSLDEANKKARELVEHCVKNKFKELLLITGKGLHSTNDEDIYVSKDLGKLKYSVPEFIKTHPELSKFVISIKDAEKQDGGAGALIIKLKNL